jgi:hypothetical protein
MDVDADKGNIPSLNCLNSTELNFISNLYSMLNNEGLTLMKDMIQKEREHS